MKKFLMGIVIFFILVGIGGYALWHFGTNYASEKIFDQVESHLDNEKISKVKSYIEKDPKLQEMLQEGANVNPDSLPFQTKEEATRVIIKKVGVNRLLDMKEKAENGSISVDQAISEVEGELSEDEVTALKYVIYKELYK